jgi:hypothetical protein
MTRARLIMFGVVALAIVAAIAWIRAGGEKAGAAKVEQRVERNHAARIVEARTDERTAGDVAASIDRRVARVEDLSTAAVAATVKDLRDAIDANPPSAADAALPPAPVDSLRDQVNAVVDCANRATETTGALCGADQD